jgi:cytoskeletal protein CcmA (bactofilin family)
MAIFNNKPSTADRPPQSRADLNGADSSMSVIGGGMRIIGDVESNGVIKIEGFIEGSVRGARQVLLGRTGIVHGDIYSADAVLGGRVVGTVIASERVEIQGTSGIEGDIHTKSIVVHEGAMINGTVRMGEVTASSAPSNVSQNTDNVEHARDGGSM